MCFRSTGKSLLAGSSATTRYPYKHNEESDLCVCLLRHNLCELNNQKNLDQWILGSRREKETIHRKAPEVHGENNAEIAELNFDAFHPVAKQIRADIAHRLFNDGYTIN